MAGMGTVVDDAYDALPAQHEVGDATLDATPEAAARRGVLGATSFDLLNDAGITDQSARDRQVVDSVIERVAGCYLYARGARSEVPSLAPAERRRNVIGQIIHEGGGLPQHVELMIRHQPHVGDYRSVVEWLEMVDALDVHEIEPEDRAEILRTGEVWEICWHPNTPVGSHSVCAATLERALELANDPGYR